MVQLLGNITWLFVRWTSTRAAWKCDTNEWGWLKAEEVIEKLAKPTPRWLWLEDVVVKVTTFGR